MIFVKVEHHDGTATYEAEEAYVTRTPEGGTLRLDGCRRVVRYIGRPEIRAEVERYDSDAISHCFSRSRKFPYAAPPELLAQFQIEDLRHERRTIAVPNDAATAYIMDSHWKTREIVRARG